MELTLKMWEKVMTKEEARLHLAVMNLKWDVSAWLCVFSNYIQLWSERYVVGWHLYNAKIGV